MEFSSVSPCSDCPSTGVITVRILEWAQTSMSKLNSELSTIVLTVENLKKSMENFASNMKLNLLLIFPVCVLEACRVGGISVVEEPSTNGNFSLQAQWREHRSCLFWTALIPACLLALVSGLVISVSGPSQQPAWTLTSQRGPHLRRDRCQQPTAPLLLLLIVQANPCWEGATYLKLSNMEGRVIPATCSQLLYRQRPELHRRVRKPIWDMGHPPEEIVPVREHPRLLRSTSWLTDALTDSFIVSLEEQEWKTLIKRPFQHRPHSVELGEELLVPL